MQQCSSPLEADLRLLRQKQIDPHVRQVSHKCFELYEILQPQLASLYGPES